MVNQMDISIDKDVPYENPKLDLPFAGLEANMTDSFFVPESQASAKQVRQAAYYAGRKLGRKFRTRTGVKTDDNGTRIPGTRVWRKE